jgi:hypothetical protein
LPKTRRSAAPDIPLRTLPGAFWRVTLRAEAWLRATARSVRGKRSNASPAQTTRCGHEKAGASGSTKQADSEARNCLMVRGRRGAIGGRIPRDSASADLFQASILGTRKADRWKSRDGLLFLYSLAPSCLWGQSIASDREWAVFVGQSFAARGVPDRQDGAICGVSEKAHRRRSVIRGCCGSGCTNTKAHDR